MNWLTFIPKAQDRISPGDDLGKVTLPEIDSLPILKLVTDGETVQCKAFEYAFGVLFARGFADQEDAHAKWNAFKKAISRSKLGLIVLKLTLVCCLVFVWLAEQQITYRNSPPNPTLLQNKTIPYKGLLRLIKAYDTRLENQPRLCPF
ncbi:Uncharacterized protein SCF082_LOCUS94 [Durusdinium trenchii]